MEIRPQLKAEGNINFLKANDVYYLEYELIWGGVDCASGGIYYHYNWLKIQDKICGGSFRIGTEISTGGTYSFTFGFKEAKGEAGQQIFIWIVNYILHKQYMNLMVEIIIIKR